MLLLTVHHPTKSPHYNVGYFVVCNIQSELSRGKGPALSPLCLDREGKPGTIHREPYKGHIDPNRGNQRLPNYKPQFQMYDGMISVFIPHPSSFFSLLTLPVRCSLSLTGCLETTPVTPVRKLHGNSGFFAGQMIP